MTTKIGIESINAYCGQASLDIKTLFAARDLDLTRFDNLMMQKKSVNLPCEDSVTSAVNAAKPILDPLSQSERNQIALLITATETGLDFGKSLSTYIYPYLNLSKNCRLFEIKQACYGGTAALQMAAAWVSSQPSSQVKALIIATDAARAAARKTYAEPSQGTGAVAMLISKNPEILILDNGATGYYGYEIMDTCRPEPDLETGNPDLSLLSYLDCLDNCYRIYCEKVEDINIQTTFNYFAFHTPFAGMVKGAHRQLLRKNGYTDAQFIEADFQKRVAPSLVYCEQVGNIYSATVYLALCGIIDNTDFINPKRVGIFSYGSGCCAEFYSGILQPIAKEKLGILSIKQSLENRYLLDMLAYEKIIDINQEWFFGVKNKNVDITPFEEIYTRQFANKGLLILDKIENYKRYYRWS
ncbi:3-hydroxy-3-methylglutaryl-ACP synthase [Coxiella burnetii]|uniref:Hydroxymethylglutaryl-CoA synthase family protein n=1 Tax=Coxiella burnetii (strain Dugway 5J108-111) TaxID=434922 RepID=A9KEM5_COXBN|nr:hydroxymethylglutaryl-CoA synthase [Coxiella burnetii]ABS76536.1 hydroxymethylglutaryl-CoA synthase family protein [Coxiella burnetii Dugway 5J108-111]OYK79407.1 3-hydroxy-3-methylglutaryl-ACP synthase [Coxiella burnetii]OYK81488.1 3-hydroxy-3-methylglutaryl-ACP synthase [Coxiella burnetii]